VLIIQEDSVLFASTNFPDRLDEAVRRPGRFDVFVEFNYANRDQIEGLYRHFYTGTGDQPIQNLDRDPDEKAELLPSLSYGDQTEVGTAGAKFADVVAGKGIKVSVATVQGYLLLYKKDPKLALAKAEDWAEGIRVQQDV
jgi:chaperone BCS1